MYAGQISQQTPDDVTLAATMQEISIRPIHSESGLPDGITRAAFVAFLAEHLEPYGDPPHHIDASIEYAFSESDGRGGVLFAAMEGNSLVGAMIVNHTGMGGYIPEHHLVYVAVDSSRRGLGIGSKLIAALREECPGNIALHVEYDNPARGLYEHLGFTSKYAEMRLNR
jgi:[ribosomal protein S18]-alanine N-acetyltransferase